MVDTGVQVEPRRQARAPGREAPAGSRGSRILSSTFTTGTGRRRSAMRSASRAATSRLVITGQSSIPSASTRWIVLRSPPKVPVPGETSLARIQSQRLRRRLRRAFSTTSSVSAAKPIDEGRPVVAALGDASRGCRGSRRGAAPAGRRRLSSACAGAAVSTRQSATAAAITATSTGSAASQAASISAAVSTGDDPDPGRRGLLRRSRDEHRVGAESRERRRDRMPLLARGVVRDVAHRDRSARGSARSSPAPGDRRASHRRPRYARSPRRSRVARPSAPSRPRRRQARPNRVRPA